jgi:hypothetical protein
VQALTVNGGRNDQADVVARVKERLGRAEAFMAENRRAWLEDVKFSCADDQWTPEAKRMRGEDRPALTFNRLNGIVKQIIGDYRQNKLSIKILPADGDASEESAELIAGLIRNIEAQSNADMAYVTALDHAVRGGFGYFRVVPRYAADDVFEQDLVILPVHNPLTVHFDPSARLVTREDAEWCIITDRLPRDQFRRLYPEAKAEGFDTAAGDGWADGDEFRVAEEYEKEYHTGRLVAFSNGMTVPVESDAEVRAMERLGFRVVREREAQRTRIRWRKVTAAQVLEERVYDARYIPVIPVLGEEVNVEGKVYTRSAIFYSKDAQRCENYSYSTAIESLALQPRAPWLLTPTQVQGHEDQWEKANVTPQPYLLYNVDPEAGKPDRVNPPGTPVGEISMAVNASDLIKATSGIYDASLGARSNETSGKAIVARQQQGANSTFLFPDNLKEAIQHGGKVVVDYLRTTHDTERVVRVLGLEGNAELRTINERRYDPLTGVTEILNSVTTGKYDVIVEAGPAFANRKAEAVNGMLQFMQAMPAQGALVADLAVEHMDWPGADKFAERLRRALPPQLTEDADSPEARQQMAAAQRQQAQAGEAAGQAEAMKLRSEQAKSVATVARAEADVVKSRADVTTAQLGVVQAVQSATRPQLTEYAAP